MPFIVSQKAKKPKKPEWQDVAPSDPELREAYEVAAKHEAKFARRVRKAFNELNEIRYNESLYAGQHSTLYDPWRRAVEVIEQYDEAFQRFALSMSTAYREVIVEAAKNEFRRQGWFYTFDPDGNYTTDFLDQMERFWSNHLKTEKTQQISDILIEGLEGKSARQVAREIADLDMGLLPQHEDTIKRAAKAMEEDLIAQGLPKKQIKEQVDKFIARKTKRLKNYRAESIARTETIRAEAAGTQQSWQTARDQGIIPGARRVWIASGKSPRTCRICLSLDGKQTTLDDPFEGSFEVVDKKTGNNSTRNTTAMIPPAHTMCRCTIGLEFDEAELDRFLEEE